MARARNIKPGLFKNEILGVADPIYTLLFEGLWVLADREGRIEDRPLRIKAEIFPYREGLNIDEMLNWLQTNGFIRRYVARGKKCIVVCEFAKHQNPHKNESDSELPAPEGEVSNSEEIGRSTEIIGSARADSLNSDSLFEPNGSVGKADALPRCDTQSVVDLYHDTLPELPRVRLMTDGRRKAISAFWRFVLTSKKSDGSPRATNADEAMDWISGYFTRARDNDFLMGRGHKAPGHEGWQCDFDFLLTEKGKKHVIEKTKEAA